MTHPVVDQRPLYDASLELKAAAEDLLRSRYQFAQGALQRFVAQFRRGTPLGDLASAILPRVDFNTWYEAACGTVGSFVGSGTLEWPVAAAERVALQLELLHHVAKGQRGILDFCVSFLFVENNYEVNTAAFLEQIVQPFYRDWLRVVKPSLDAEEARLTRPARSSRKDSTDDFVDQDRLSALRSLNSGNFDLSRVILVCEELNKCWRDECYTAVAMLTRGLLDHVPPIFGARSFAEVASSYGGGKSFKETAGHLENSARKIADGHLHVQIRKRESLPTRTQVNFSRDLDVVLAEIVRILS